MTDFTTDRTAEVDAPDHAPVAQPVSGPVLGSRGRDGIYRFAGIAYATADRFEPPQPLPQHTEPVDATLPGAICPQLPSRLQAAMGEHYGEPPQTEECLNLSITTPGLSGDRPVMVWLHGGGFLSGAGTLPCYDGGRLSADGDVVVVSVNYRVGAFGYLVLDGVSDGNLGLLDQVCALEWVRDNVSAFGGDPDNITVFGQSAGALSTIELLSVPQTRSLIKRAIVQSVPSPELVQARDEALEVGRYFESAVDGDIRSASVEDLLAAQLRTLQWFAAKNPMSVAPPFSIVLDHPLGAREQNDGVLNSGPFPEMMIGYTTQECLAFAVGVTDEKLIATLNGLTSSLMIEPARAIAHDYSRAGGAVYSYELAWEPENGGYGAIHCLELPFMLGTPESWRGSPMLGDCDWATVERIGKPIREMWARFARSGAPTDLPETWPRWSGGVGRDARLETVGIAERPASTGTETSR